MLPLLFFATFYITLKVLSNNNEITKLDEKISEQNILLRQNQATLSKISELETKISSFSQTQAILDSASVGTEVWSIALEHLSEFFQKNKDIWVTKLTNEGGGNIVLDGYALNRRVLTTLAFSIKSAELKSVNYEAIRDKSAYKFNLIFNLLNYQKSLE